MCGHMGNPPMDNGQTDTTENITFPETTYAGANYIWSTKYLYSQ